jgi:hypothetical protein
VSILKISQNNIKMRSTGSSEQMRWEEWTNETKVPLRVCTQHLHLYQEITELLTHNLSKRCFMLEKQWFDRFMSYGSELLSME